MYYVEYVGGPIHLRKGWTTKWEEGDDGNTHGYVYDTGGHRRGEIILDDHKRPVAMHFWHRHAVDVRSVEEGKYKFFILDLKDPENPVKISEETFDSEFAASLYGKKELRFYCFPYPFYPITIMIYFLHI